MFVPCAVHDEGRRAIVFAAFCPHFGKHHAKLVAISCTIASGGNTRGLFLIRLPLVPRILVRARILTLPPHTENYHGDQEKPCW